MTIADILREAIHRFPPGKIFSYSDLAETNLKHTTMVIQLNRLVQSGEVARVLRGRFVAVNEHQKKVSAPEIIHAICHYRNRVCGYETGPSVWEKWGLLPAAKNRKEYYVSITQMRPAQKHGKITVRFKRAKLDPARYNHEIMQFLDALESVNNIAEKSKVDILEIMQQIFRSWNESNRNQLAGYALAYKPVTRALTGAILQNEGFETDARRLAVSLHPATTYVVRADCSRLQNTNDWKIICPKTRRMTDKKTTKSNNKSK